MPNLPAVTPHSASTALRGLAGLGQSVLATVVQSGLLRCAVPVALGGRGGSHSELADGARSLAAVDPAAGWVLWAQRLAIEALVHSPNIGLRDYLLPDLLTGERAGTLPLPPWPDAIGTQALPLAAAAARSGLVAMGEPQGMRLYGQLPCVPNLQWQGFALIAPVSDGHPQQQWVLLRSEEDGLRAGIDLGSPCPRGSRCAALTLDGVFFRADEELAGPELPTLLQPTALALAAGLVPA